MVRDWVLCLLTFRHIQMNRTVVVSSRGLQLGWKHCTTYEDYVKYLGVIILSNIDVSVFGLYFQLHSA